MKTLVKYTSPENLLNVRCTGQATRSMTAKQLIAAGLGDNTVMEDKKTVWVAKGQFSRLNS
jgi:hypothetical protein